MNIRYELSQGLFLRGAVSKSVTRPDFLQLSPPLVLNVSQRNGTAGNPALQPVRSDNFDVAIEKYFDSSVANIVGALPIYTQGYGWLDALLAYRINDYLSFTLEGLNLLNTQRKSYFGLETRPQTVWSNDTQVGVTVAVKF